MERVVRKVPKAAGFFWVVEIVIQVAESTPTAYPSEDEIDPKNPPPYFTNIPPAALGAIGVIAPKGPTYKRGETVSIERGQRPPPNSTFVGTVPVIGCVDGWGCTTFVFDHYKID
ncbi:MAG: hypothetical protein AB7F88_18330 [Pyrinomonadaceae bacterium]